MGSFVMRNKITERTIAASEGAKDVQLSELKKGGLSSTCFISSTKKGWLHRAPRWNGSYQGKGSIRIHKHSRHRTNGFELSSLYSALIIHHPWVSGCISGLLQRMASRCFYSKDRTVFLFKMHHKFTVIIPHTEGRKNLCAYRSVPEGAKKTFKHSRRTHTEYCVRFCQTRLD
jgi:hypothetical protein